MQHHSTNVGNLPADTGFHGPCNIGGTEAPPSSRRGFLRHCLAAVATLTSLPLTLRGQSAPIPDGPGPGDTLDHPLHHQAVALAQRYRRQFGIVGEATKAHEAALIDALRPQLHITEMHREDPAAIDEVPVVVPGKRTTVILPPAPSEVSERTHLLFAVAEHLTAAGVMPDPALLADPAGWMVAFRSLARHREALRCTFVQEFCWENGLK